MLAFTALPLVFALVSAAPARLQARQADVPTTDAMCISAGGTAPAAIVTTNGVARCACMNDAHIGAANSSVTLCQDVSPAYNGDASATNGQQNQCSYASGQPVCGSVCLPGYERTPGNGACQKVQSSSTVVTTTASPTSHYCGFGTADDGKCNPPPTSTSTSTSYYCGYGTADDGKCNPPSSTSHYCGFGTADDGKCNPPPSSTSTSYYCGYGTANGGKCNPPSSTVTPSSHYCGFGTDNKGRCNPPSSTTTPPPSSVTSHYCGFGTADGGRCNPPSSTHSAPVSSITGAANPIARLPSYAVHAGSAFAAAFALFGFVL